MSEKVKVCSVCGNALRHYTESHQIMFRDQRISELKAELEAVKKERDARQKLVMKYQKERKDWKVKKLDRDRLEIIAVEKDRIPEGGKLIEAYEYKDQIIIMGYPEPEKDPDNPIHNCDAMGCGSIGSHVLYRIKISELKQALKGGSR